MTTTEPRSADASLRRTLAALRCFLTLSIINSLLGRSFDRPGTLLFDGGMQVSSLWARRVARRWRASHG
jgi:hypothetical protein